MKCRRLFAFVLLLAVLTMQAAAAYAVDIPELSHGAFTDVDTLTPEQLDALSEALTNQESEALPLPEPSDNEYHIFAPPSFDISTVFPNGAVIGTAESGEDTRFYIIQTTDGHTFFLVISGASVYLLDEVSSRDLESFANGDSSSGGFSLFPQTSAPPVSAAPSPEPAAPSYEISPVLIQLVLVLGVIVIFFGVFYYFKIYRKKKNNDSTVKQPETEASVDDYYEYDPENDEPDITYSYEESDEDEIQNNPDMPKMLGTDEDEFDPMKAERRAVPDEYIEPDYEEDMHSSEEADIFK